MHSLSKNRYIDALFKTILVAAIFHLLLLLVYTFTTRIWTNLNIFNIIDINLFFGQVVEGVASFILSWFFILIIYLLVFKLLTSSNDKKS